MNTPLSLCIFCGSRKGVNPAYRDAAHRLGSGIAQRGWHLIYGAGDTGIMEACASATQKSGGCVTGVIPKHMIEYAAAKSDLSRTIVTKDMHERKKEMLANADAIILLPGGLGSLDEFFETLTWAQLGLHQKPVFVLNTQDYWNPMIKLIQHTITQGFADESILTLFETISTTDTLLLKLEHIFAYEKRPAQTGRS